MQHMLAVLITLVIGLFGTVTLLQSHILQNTITMELGSQNAQRRAITESMQESQHAAYYDAKYMYQADVVRSIMEAKHDMNIYVNLRNSTKLEFRYDGTIWINGREQDLSTEEDITHIYSAVWYNKNIPPDSEYLSTINYSGSGLIEAYTFTEQR